MNDVIVVRQTVLVKAVIVVIIVIVVDVIAVMRFRRDQICQIVQRRQGAQHLESVARVDPFAQNEVRDQFLNQIVFSHQLVHYHVLMYSVSVFYNV